MTIADRIGALAPAVPVEVFGVPTRFIPHRQARTTSSASSASTPTGIARTVRESC